MIIKGSLEYIKIAYTSSSEIAQEEERGYFVAFIEIVDILYRMYNHSHDDIFERDYIYSKPS